jgi:hypothetical protein
MKIDTLSNLQTNLKDDSLRTNINIVDMQTNDILILIDLNSIVTKEKAIVDVKIMTKLRKDLDSNCSLKFNDMIIERQENDIYLRQIFQLNHFQLIKIVDFIIIILRDKIKFALISKKKYVA